MACITADDQGTAYSGGANGLIYIWNGRTLKKTLEVHSGGFVGSINWILGKLYSGGKDGKINVIDTAGDYAVLQTFDMGGVLPRAIDCYQEKMIVGMMSGSIIEIDLAT